MLYDLLPQYVICENVPKCNDINKDRNICFANIKKIIHNEMLFFIQNKNLDEFNTNKGEIIDTFLQNDYSKYHDLYRKIQSDLTGEKQQILQEMLKIQKINYSLKLFISNIDNKVNIQNDELETFLKDICNIFSEYYNIKIQY